MKNNSPLESKEQIQFIHEAKRHLRSLGLYHLKKLLFSIPNGGKRDARTAAQMKLEGVVPGVPDLMFAVPIGEYHGLFIEMKRRKGGRTSPEQKELIPLLGGQGYRVEVARGSDEALEIFKSYLEGE